MICYVLAMGKQRLRPHVVMGYGIKIFWPGLFITSPDHLEKTYYVMIRFSARDSANLLLVVHGWALDGEGLVIRTWRLHAFVFNNTHVKVCAKST